ncbi:LON peptidase substrate-binding domain-containing protein [Thaumasiovibrio sp. DFM-14]|uniref:LON peptidase substrate-binding domain-containing protein n=1 Tax=Thaumasiovibrio sp. DFM-14 TaxID=3384792 RepID=UPI00399F6291
MTNTLPVLFQKRHILPDGRLPMRIAPGGQMDTIKHALRNGGILGICMYDPADEQQFYEIGTRVRIEDFDTDLVNGLLQITVVGLDTFEVVNFYNHESNICLADYESTTRWPETAPSVPQKMLAERLQIMYDKHPELSDLHNNKQLNNLSWLCQRWLELLPVPVREKQQLLTQPNCLNTCDYLMSLMQEPH